MIRVDRPEHHKPVTIGPDSSGPIDFIVTLHLDQSFDIFPPYAWFAFRLDDLRIVRWHHIASGFNAANYIFEVTADWGSCQGTKTSYIKADNGILQIPQNLLRHPGAISWKVGLDIPGLFNSGFNNGFSHSQQFDTFSTYSTGINCRPLAGRFDIPRIPILPYA